ncbi:ABC transporter substrate-binding protein [Brevibacterium antiquum]|uniref:ABC transporter substrate-binding protein n=1 Tax=Brevibacterium antiquum TaxID=234835 RepID=UPI0018E05B56
MKFHSCTELTADDVLFSLNYARDASDDDYWEESVPSLHSVTFNVVSEDNTRRLQLQGGQAHIDEEPVPLSMSTMDRSQDVSATAFEATKILYFNLNTTVEGLDDPKVRRATSYAVDRKSVVDVVSAGYGDPASSFISPGRTSRTSSTRRSSRRRCTESAARSSTSSPMCWVRTGCGRPNSSSSDQCSRMIFPVVARDSSAVKASATSARE